MPRSLLEATEDEMLRAMAMYNWPAGGGQFYTPDHEANYRRGLAEARTILGTPVPVPVPTPSARVTYDPNFPATIQDDDWSCAPSSLDWALRSLGRAPGHSYIENLLIADGIVSKAQGLLVGTGGPLAAWIGKKVPPDVYYGADGFYGRDEQSVTFDDAALEGNHSYPILVGGHNWGGAGKGHWSGVRGFDAVRDVLLLANPAGSSGVFGGQEMTRTQWNARAPFSMVRVLHNDLLTAVPAPPPAIDPRDARIAELEALVTFLGVDLGAARTQLGVASTLYAQTIEDIAKALRALKPAA